MHEKFLSIPGTRNRQREPETNRIGQFGRRADGPSTRPSTAAPATGLAGVLLRAHEHLLAMLERLVLQEHADY